jgi:hypothetical protein
MGYSEAVRERFWQGCVQLLRLELLPVQDLPSTHLLLLAIFVAWTRKEQPNTAPGTARRQTFSVAADIIEHNTQRQEALQAWAAALLEEGEIEELPDCTNTLKTWVSKG